MSQSDSNTMTWFLVRSKVRQEEVALTNLERQGYECYLPMYMTEKIIRRRKTIVCEPMFSRYLFVNLDITGKKHSWAPIRSTIGVSELVRFGGQLAKVDMQLIALLHEREEMQQKKPQTLFVAGTNVVITDGAFAGLEAIYQMDDAEGRAMVLLEILSRPVQMKLDAARLRKAV